MKYRCFLGLIVSLMACSKEDDATPNGGSGGTAGGQTANTGGSSTAKGGSSGSANGGASNTGGKAVTPGGGNATGGAVSGGGTGPTGGVANGGNAPTGGTASPGGGADVGGAPPVGGSGGGTPPMTTGASVLERNGGPTREGHWVQPALTKAAAAKMTLEAGFKAEFKGNMYASPLFVENGPGGKGVFIAVSADNTVAALDETTGAAVWSKTLGTSPGAEGQACFKGDPVGILSTPVIDEKAGTIFVAAAIGTGSVERHEIHALAVADGASRTGFPINVGDIKAGGLSFNTEYQNQRSALSLVNGIVYVGYGGFIGDCNDYHGWIIAVDAADASKTAAWATAGKGEAVWAAGGFASDGTSIFPVTGNNIASTSDRSKSDSEAVLRLSGMAQFERTDKNQFYPANWQSMDSADADLGGTNSMLIRVAGSTPERLVVAIGKDGRFFLLDPENLGGSDGEVVTFQAATTTQAAQGAVKTVPAAYTTAKGTYVTFTVDSSPQECPNNQTGRAVMGVRINAGAPPTADVAWCAPGPNPSSAPIATTTDGKADAIVWFMSGSNLVGVDGDTGESVFSGGSCSGVQRWTSPIAVKGRIVTGANGKLCSWAPE